MNKFDIFKYNMLLGGYKGFKVHYNGSAEVSPKTRQRYLKNKAEADRRGVERGDWKSLENVDWLK